MRIVVVSALTFVMGAVLGGLPVRAELREAERVAAEAQECATEGAGSELSRWFTGRPVDRASQADATVEPPSGPEADAPTPPAEPESRDTGAPAVEVRFGDEPADASPSRQEGIELAREALDLRRTQAYASLIEDGQPDDYQLAAIDDALAGMNDELLVLADDLLSQVQASGEPSRRDMMSFGAEALDIFVAADDAMHDALSPEQVDALQKEAIDPFSYIDPALLDRFAEIERLGVQ